MSRASLPIRALLAGAILVTPAAHGQAGRPPLPPPPIRRAVLCAVRLEELLGAGLNGTDGIEDRAAAGELIESMYQNERDRFTRQVEDELGPLAFAVFVPGEISAGEKRLEELAVQGCVHQALARGRDSADPEVRARSQQIWDRFHAPATLPEPFFSPEQDERAPEGAQARAAAATLRLELPPSDLIVPGEVITGRVVDDTLGVSQDRVVERTLATDLLVAAAGQTVRVGREGLFVLRAPERAGTYTVEVRQHEKLLPVPVEAAFTIAERGRAATAADAKPSDAAPSRPAVDCPGFDEFLVAAIEGAAGAAAPAGCSVVAPRVVLPDQRLIVLGGLRRGGGLATRAFVGPWETPLLAKTPIAAVFDVSRVPAGSHALALFDGGQLIAAARVDRVTLVARSDRSELARGEVATFTVRVDGLPLGAPAADAEPSVRGDGAAVAFLDYTNNSPAVGRFRDQPDRFSVPIARGALSPSPLAERGADQRALIARIEQLLVGAAALRPGSLDGGAASQPRAAPGTPPPAPDASGAASSGGFDDVRQYRGAGVGDFRVRVTVRVPEESAKLAPAIVPEPAGDGAAQPRPGTGVDQRGAFVEVDGWRFYVVTGYPRPTVSLAPAVPPQSRLFETTCSGSCQCHIQSWEHAVQVGEQVKALDRTNPDWRSLTAKAHGCACEEVRSQCYSLLSYDCKARCKRYFESSLTDRVSGFAVDAKVGPCADVGACDR